MNPDDVDETRLTRVEAIITSMTHEEREDLKSSMDREETG
ncbi:MAG: hypothetical protein Ct9H90mP11_05240 [Acidimicrobiales bacterium]|nr:MAG: hypothetical protein Ct9H90mP11_05240 [Acidimicrobiales bacterium]